MCNFVLIIDCVFKMIAKCLLTAQGIIIKVKYWQCVYVRDF